MEVEEKAIEKIEDLEVRNPESFAINFFEQLFSDGKFQIKALIKD